MSRMPNSAGVAPRAAEVDHPVGPVHQHHPEADEAVQQAPDGPLDQRAEADPGRDGTDKGLATEEDLEHHHAGQQTEDRLGAGEPPQARQQCAHRAG